MMSMENIPEEESELDAEERQKALERDQ